MIFICFSLIVVSVMSHSNYNVSMKNAKNGLSYSINKVGFYEIFNIHGKDSIKVKFSKENLRLFAIFTQDSQIALNHLFIDDYDSIKNVISSSETVSYSVDAEEEAIFEFKSLKNKNSDDDEDDEENDENKIDAKFWLLPRETCGKSSIFEFGGTGSNLTVGLSEKLITSQNSKEIKYTNCIFSPLFDISKPYSLSFGIHSVENSVFSRSKIDFFTDDVNRPDWTIKSDKKEDENERNYSTSKPFFVKYEIVQKSDDGQFIWPFDVETRMTRKMIGKKKGFDFNSVSLGCFYGVFECCNSWSCFRDIEFEEMIVVKCDNENLIKILKIVALVVGIVLFVIIVASIVGCCCCCNCCGMIDCCCCCCVDCSCCCCCDCCSCKKKNKKEKQQVQQNVGSSNSIPQIMNRNKSGQQNDIELPLMDINQQQQQTVNQEIVANPYGLNPYENTEVQQQQQQQQTPEPISPYNQEQVPYF